MTGRLAPRASSRRREDPVSPELRRYVLARDRGCVVQRVAPKLRRTLEPCQDRNGTALSTIEALFVAPADWDRILTIAHVRDRLGGRIGKRPPSTPRRLAAVCFGHHLTDPIVDRGDVRPLVDAYLEEQEGPELDDDRPWEVVRRIRRPVDVEG